MTNNKKTIVLKVGTKVLSDEGVFNNDRFLDLINFIVEVKNNFNVVLISSGAVALGYERLNLDRSLTTNKQILSSIGQADLICKYKQSFNSFDIDISQVLVDNSVFKDNKKITYLTNTLNGLINNDILTIINENDSCNIEELVVSDNDALSYLICSILKPYKLLILSDIDGVLDLNGEVVKEINDLNYLENVLLKENNITDFGTGGISSKVENLTKSIEFCEECFLGSGFDLDNVKNYLNGRDFTATIFKG